MCRARPVDNRQHNAHFLIRLCGLRPATSMDVLYAEGSGAKKAKMRLDHIKSNRSFFVGLGPTIAHEKVHICGSIPFH